MAWKILLADDSVTAQNMGRKILTDAGYEVITVNNGSAALKRVAETKPDLIVLDVYMPGYSGLEVCQRLKDAPETAHIPVLLTVGKLEPFKAEEGRRVGADHHIIKPFEASELLSAINNLEDRITAQTLPPAKRLGGNLNPPGEDSAAAEGGWKSRFSFSSKKKKDEKEVAEAAPAAGGANFRDFRKAKVKPAASETTEPNPAHTTAQQSHPGAGLANSLPNDVPSVVPDAVPDDITAAELDALSRFASKLSSPAAAATAQVEKDPEKDSEKKTEKDAEEEAIPQSEEYFPATAAQAMGIPIPPPVSSGVSTPNAASLAPVECPAFTVEGRNEFETHPTSFAPAPQQFLSSDTANPVTQPSEVASTAAGMAAEVAEPVPADVDDRYVESSYASSPIETPAHETAATPENLRNSDVDELVAAPPQREPSTATNRDAGNQRDSEGLTPTDAELVEALRLLTPATTEDWTVPSNDKLVAVGQLLAEEAMRTAAAGPRWVAESVKLTPEEAATSLEAEMARSSSGAISAGMPAMAETITQPPVNMPDAGDWRGITGLPAITAAVESRMAESDLAELTKALAEHPEAQTALASGNAGGRTEIGTSDDVPPGVPPHVLSDVLNEVPQNEVPQKAMAAAAAESSATASAPDARTIASIVDSVMADLRPKILEEITRKLAGK